MREIKFRAWDKTFKKYRRFDGRHDTMMISRDGSVEYYNLQNGSGGNEYILEQFTGLKDKNGVDIFEGDIVRMYDTERLTFQVNYNNRKCGFYVGADQLLDSDCGNIEVISNIHENPELLEATT